MMGRYGRMGFFRRPSRIDRRKVDEALERVGMTAFRRRQIGELSGGQRKRVFLARALAQEGLIILLDEPFTGVDVKTEASIINLLRELKAQGHLILVVAMLITPGAIAYLLSNRFHYMLLIAAAVAIGSIIAGTLVSFHIDGATGPCIVLVQMAAFIAAFVFSRRGSAKRDAANASHSAV